MNTTPVPYSSRRTDAAVAAAAAAAVLVRPPLWSIPTVTKRPDARDTLDAGDNQAKRRNRGRAVGAWLRAAMTHPSAGTSLSASEVAKLIGRQASVVNIWVNDCVDAAEDRVKLPRPENIDKLAEVLGADANAGRLAAGYAPVPLTGRGSGMEGERAAHELARYLDSESMEAVRYFESLPREMRAAALSTLRGMSDAGQIARQINARSTVGKRADRTENPARVADEDGDQTNQGDHEASGGTGK